MEFTEPTVTPASEGTVLSEVSSNEENRKTEEQIHRLENEIDKSYSALESKMGELWKNADSKYHLDEKTRHLHEQIEKQRAQLTEQYDKRRQQVVAQLAAARESEPVKDIEQKLRELPIDAAKDNLNRGLDAVDEQLEKLENAAIGYASSFASFFSKVVSIEPSEPDKASTPQPETLFSRDAFLTDYGSSRYEQELYKLHTSDKVYLEPSEDAEKIDIEAKTEEIASLLKKYPALEQTMHELADKVEYREFWQRYFAADARLKQTEERRQALTKAVDAEEEEEEFTWSDEDDAATAPVNNATKSSATTTASEKQTPDTTNGDDDDDEDDDWE
ncbi:hypothetical protein DICA3_B06590 [Diutina catenulata]